jgi:hypothetical protein
MGDIHFTNSVDGCVLNVTTRSIIGAGTTGGMDPVQVSYED